MIVALHIPTTYHNSSPFPLRALSDEELYSDNTVEEVNWSSLSYEMVGVSIDFS